MQIRIVEGPGAPWAGTGRVDDGAVWFGGEPYCPLDDFRGVLLEEASTFEIAALTASGFDLDWIQ